MKIKTKLWPLEGEQGFEEIWPSDLVFKLTWPIFKYDWDIIMLNILVKFHEEWSKTVASRGWTTQMLTAQAARQEAGTQGDHNSSPWALSAQVS